MSSLWVIHLLFTALIGTALADVFSCGGFVKSSVPIDYSQIKVKLLTPEGHLKHEEGVNAANGYYMIPVYSKGSYSIRVFAPDGWFFEPASFDFKLDGKTDKCTLEEDINFQLTAFSIVGAVESGEGHGPSGLTLSLIQNGKVVSTSTTTEGGKYRFEAPPGKYSVATGADSSVCISRGEATVEVKGSPVKVHPALRISGYPLDISVSSSGTTISGVELSLFSKTDPKLSGCHSSSSEDSSKGAFVCSLGKTNAKGSLRVSCVPPGVFNIQPSKENLFFEPSLRNVELLNEKKSVSFSVSGVKAKGRVVVNGKPVEGVDVLVNGKIVGKTDSTGNYTLEKAKEGAKLKVTAKDEHTKFLEVETSLSIDKLSIPDIAIEGFELCGSVEKGSDGSVEPLVLSSSLHGTSSIRPDSNGHFCKMVVPGKYTITPANGDSSLSPRKMDIDLSSRPSLDTSFTHFKTDVDATVTCIGACEPISLSLVSKSGNTVATAKGVESFTFKGVSPGKYTVRVPEGGRFCWEQSELPLTVDQSRPSSLGFMQNGVNTHVFLSHSAKITWTHNDEREMRGQLEGKKGMNDICLPTAGSYRIEISSCMTFDKQVLSVTVPSDTRYEAIALSAIVNGRVEGAKGAGPMKIILKSASIEREVSVSANGEFTFQEPLTTAGGKLIVTPMSDTHLFDPTSITIAFNGECMNDAAIFTATKGIFIDGLITPAVEGAAIVAVHKKDPNVVFKTITDKTGQYRVGPVRVGEDLKITATKDGYSFTQGTQHGQLKSVKLSQLTLTFEDETTGDRLNEVILYVRGTGGEKSQHRVEKDGQIKLAALAPGTYIRAVLQEYEFDPSTITVTMKEGEHDEKVMKGKRVSYSAYGGVREMSGSPVGDVLVEALSEQCDQHQSETTTNTEGVFRMRGLKPGCTYRVSLRVQEGRSPPPHSFPSSFHVKMTAEDVKGLEMVAAPLDEGVEVVVDIGVHGLKNAPRPSLRVTVTKDETGETVSTQVLPPPVTICVVRNLSRDGSTYTVTVEAERNSQIPFTSATSSFIADKAVKTVHVDVSPSKAAHEVEISKGSIFAMIFFSLMIAFILNPTEYIEKAKSLAIKLQQHAAAAAAPQTQTATKQKRK